MKVMGDARRLPSSYFMPANSFWSACTPPRDAGLDGGLWGDKMELHPQEAIMAFAYTPVAQAK